MGRDRKKDYHHGELKQALLREGISELERGGWASFSMRSVAKSLDVSPTAPLHHYKTRTIYGAALAATGFEKLQGLIQREFSKKGTALDQLKAAFVAYTRFAIDNPELYRTMFSAEVSAAAEAYTTRIPKRDPDVGSLVETKLRTFDVIIQGVRGAQSGGYLRAGDAQPLARIITSLAHGLSLEFIDERVAARTGRRKAAAEMFETLLNGIGSPRRQIRVTSLKDEDEAADYRDLSPAERIGMIKELSEMSYALTGKSHALPGPSRSVVRVFTRKS